MFIMVLFTVYYHNLFNIYFHYYIREYHEINVKY